MWRVCFFAIVLLAGCGPVIPVQQLPTGCEAELSAAQLVSGLWLEEPAVWRLRQAALLEIGTRKIPLEGFLRMDTGKREARLVAMNEMGLVLFDLDVNPEGQELHRAIPQLKKQKMIAAGVAESLRRIFLQPRPDTADRGAEQDGVPSLKRPLADGQLVFMFDCQGDLRRTQMRTDKETWQVFYDQYGEYEAERLPEKIVYFDRRHAVKLSLWLREGRLEK